MRRDCLFVSFFFFSSTTKGVGERCPQIWSSKPPPFPRSSCSLWTFIIITSEIMCRAFEIETMSLLLCAIGNIINEADHHHRESSDDIITVSSSRSTEQRFSNKEGVVLPPPKNSCPSMKKTSRVARVVSRRVVQKRVIACTCLFFHPIKYKPLSLL